MRYKLAHTRVSDKIYPYASLPEKHMEEVEEGGITAPPLTEVISIEEADDKQVQLSDNGSNVRFRKAPKAFPPPALANPVNCIHGCRLQALEQTLVTYVNTRHVAQLHQLPSQ